MSMNRVSPALAEAMIPALATRESERVDFPWSTGAAKVDEQVRDGTMGRGEKSRAENAPWAMTDMFLKEGKEGRSVQLG